MRFLSRVKSVFLGTACAIAITTAVLAQTKTFDIPAGDLKTALDDYIRQSGVQLIYRVDEIRGLSTHGAHGPIAPDEALQQLLQGTGLVEHHDTSGAIVVSREVPPKNVQAASSGAAEFVVVTGTRIPVSGENSTHDVKTFDRKAVEQSGQNTVSGFLNTLPSVSVSSVDTGFGNFGAATTVNLRGLPVGTTLVLVNGRRVQGASATSYYQNDFFDLNNIPIGAVDRIEVVAAGSSAIYGSDAIAGVVNIILRNDIEGLEVNSEYGWADGTDETNSTVALGHIWDKGSFAVIGSYQTRSALVTDERRVSASNDFTDIGGPNNNFPLCFPGNIFSTNGSPLPGAPSGSNATFASVSPNGPSSGRPSLSDFNYGILNTCPITIGWSTIPATQRVGILAQANYDISDSASLFAEFMYTNIHEVQSQGHEAYLFGVPGFQSFTVAASNPFNPFGETVGIARELETLDVNITTNTSFYRGVMGARGQIADAWSWELSASGSADRTTIEYPNIFLNFAALQAALNSSDPATALNPFVAGPLGDQRELQSFFSSGRTQFYGNDETVEGFLRGTLANLPAGPVQTVFGAEFDHNSVYPDYVNFQGYAPNTKFNFSRTNFAIYGETRIPLLSSDARIDNSDILSISLAGRYDHYSDFGGTLNPQVGGEFSPFEGLRLRATYSTSFKAPTLTQLHNPPLTTPNFHLTDPSSGADVLATVTSGGNPNLKPLEGRSYTFGGTWSSASIPGLRLSLAGWSITEDNYIQSVTPQFIVNNEALFPGRVTRNSSGTIIAVNDVIINFGKIQVAGLDYQISYDIDTDVGKFASSLAATQTYQYESQLVPNAPSVSGLSRAQDSGNWAPRWKGTASLTWERGPFEIGADARYVGSYSDYDSARRIGDFWLFDANSKYQIGNDLDFEDQILKNTYLEVGGVNLFNNLPQRSLYNFGFAGYDATQADIRGQFIYIRIGTKS